jgi:hypothetical protein
MSTSLCLFGQPITSLTATELQTGLRLASPHRFTALTLIRDYRVVIRRSANAKSSAGGFILQSILHLTRKVDSVQATLSFLKFAARIVPEHAPLVQTRADDRLYCMATLIAPEGHILWIAASDEYEMGATCCVDGMLAVAFVGGAAKMKPLRAIELEFDGGYGCKEDRDMRGWRTVRCDR